MKRVLTAIVAIPILVYIVMLAPVWICVGVIFLAMLLALHEYLALVDIPLAFRLASGGIAAGACLIPVWPQGTIIVLIGALLILTVSLFSGLDLPEAFRAAVYSFFGAAYVGGLMGFLIAVRTLNRDLLSGAELLMMLFIIIWSGDSFAYFAGKSFGRHKLAPIVSPHKTWEGAVAGFVFSIVAAVVCKFTFVQEMGLTDAIIVGALIGVIGQIGDLCESIVKRAAKVKDSGGIIPGHGGMLDRLDSLLFGAPAMYYYLSFFAVPL
jgi:phosphatidate cytidylyltransferase